MANDEKGPGETETGSSCRRQRRQVAEEEGGVASEDGKWRSEVGGGRVVAERGGEAEEAGLPPWAPSPWRRGRRRGTWTRSSTATSLYVYLGRFRGVRERLSDSDATVDEEAGDELDASESLEDTAECAGQCSQN